MPNLAHLPKPPHRSVRRLRQSARLLAAAFFLSALTVGGAFGQTKPDNSLTQGGLSEGQDGFFFLDLRDLNYYTSDLKRFNSRVSSDLGVVTKLNAALAKRKIKLVFVLVPMVERIYEDKLPKGFALSPSVKDLYNKTLSTLQAQGVLAPDLNRPFLLSKNRQENRFPLYMRQDNHWSSLGGTEGARLVAESMQKELKPILATLPDHASKLTWGTPTQFVGNYSKLFDASQSQRFASEFFRPVNFTSLSNSSDLLGDGTPSIHVVGTSFTENRAFGFAEGLAHHLSKETLNVAQAAKGPWTPVFEYLASNEFQNTPPKVLVWEFPESFLAREMKPLHQAGDWGRNEFLIQSAANIGGECERGAVAQSTSAQGFEVVGAKASSASTTATSAVRYAFKSPLRVDQYVSFVANSASSNSLFLETVAAKPNRYFAKLNQYNVPQRINIPLATVADGQAQDFYLKTAPGSDLQLDDLKLCTMPKELLGLLPITTAAKSAEGVRH